MRKGIQGSHSSRFIGFSFLFLALSVASSSSTGTIPTFCPLLKRRHSPWRTVGITPTSCCLNAKSKKKAQDVTVRELMDKMMKNPEAFQQEAPKKKSRRTRKRAVAPKQKYVYASQRRNNGEPVNPRVDENNPVYLARSLGLVNPAAQHCDSVVSDVEPEIVGQVRVGDEVGTSASVAYVINKPAGWSILGGNVGAKKKKKNVPEEAEAREASGAEDLPIEEKEEEEDEQQYTTRLKVRDEDGSVGMIEFNEMDILEAMTPAEIAEFEAEGGLQGLFGVAPEPTSPQRRSAPSNKQNVDGVASFDSPTRPSVVSWLKDIKAEEGAPIRGGKFWTAVAGATNVDDTGLVVICPKKNVDNLYIDYAKYIAVVGNGKCFTPKAKTKDAPTFPKELVKMDIVSKLRKGRGDDTVLTVALTLLERFSTCTSVVQPCQAQFLDGIRGDPLANPLDRRASRRLVHCNALSVSSLVHDDTVQTETKSLPDDIRVLSDRRNHHEYKKGSFLGRSELKENPLTNAYREINGDGDGVPGWTVDRYDNFLLVQHDEKATRGPLPSIHDGNTAGVYYLPAHQSRSSMGSRTDMRPQLLEGQAAPDVLPVLENGITYHVSLERDLSTGIFLDQRPQRAWLARNCNADTRLLNCFAHCGAFSVAAATAGASTVSLDLEKKWLDRIEPQMKANGIDFDKHDCIYGDCFDWLARLSKRGELFDIVILDPPSTSVGKKKKRWSVKNDMSSLVALAAPLVKRGGLLWTTTNSASIPVTKFARMCKKGFEEVGIPGAKLERVVPMPSDFVSVGPQPVKNLVWRLP